MQKRLLIFCLLFSSFIVSHAQTDVLIVEKRGRNMAQYFAGSEIIFKTIHGQWFYGMVTAIRNDSVFVGNQLSFHYKEIGAVKHGRKKLQYRRNGSILVAAATLNVVIGLVNGVYFGKNRSNKYLYTNLAITGALGGTGLFLLKSEFKTYTIGRRYKLTYMNMQRK
jgi:hypothetical protein